MSFILGAFSNSPLKTFIGFRIDFFILFGNLYMQQIYIEKLQISSYVYRAPLKTPFIQ